VRIADKRAKEDRLAVFNFSGERRSYLSETFRVSKRGYIK